VHKAVNVFCPEHLYVVGFCLLNLIMAAGGMFCSETVVTVAYLVVRGILNMLIIHNHVEWHLSYAVFTGQPCSYQYCLFCRLNCISHPGDVTF